MDVQELIKANLREAESGLKEDWFVNADYSKWYDYVTKLLPRLQVTYLVVALDNEVFNGGFDQYYMNRFGQFSTETIRALIAIGATKKADVLEKAYKLVNIENDSDSVFRRRLCQKKLPSLFEDREIIFKLDPLDDEYFDGNDEDIVDLLNLFLKEK